MRVILVVLLIACVALAQVVAQSAAPAATSTISADQAKLAALTKQLNNPSKQPTLVKQIESLRKKLATMANIAAKNTKRIAATRKYTVKGDVRNYKTAPTGNDYYAVRGNKGKFTKKALIPLGQNCAVQSVSGKSEWGVCRKTTDCVKSTTRMFPAKGRKDQSPVCDPGSSVADPVTCCLRDTYPADSPDPANRYEVNENQRCSSSYGTMYDGVCVTERDCYAAQVYARATVNSKNAFDNTNCKWSSKVPYDQRSGKLVCCQYGNDYGGAQGVGARLWPNIFGKSKNGW